MFFRSICICHILNLCLQDAIDLNDMKYALAFIYKLVSKRSSIYKTSFKQLCEIKNVPFRTLEGDSSTRWNSTFIILRSFIPYKDIVSLFLSMHNELDI